ncbi:MAG: isochorismatase family cysteine hydrolase [Caldisericia bacterium]|jgi:nicotinamidase-related amidase|nr:isochorismatase family cysteine hydrolase [Caldisericia bacterium]
MFKNICLLIIDMQYDFIKSPSPVFVNECRDIIPNIQKILNRFREKNLPRIFVKREHRESGIDVDLPRRELFIKNGGFLIENNLGSEIINELRPNKDEIVVIKRRFSAFFGTELDFLLRRMEIKTLILTGIQTPNCIRTTAFDAISYDYEVIVISDATKSKTDEIQNANLLDMKEVGIKILLTNELLNMLK